MKCFYTFTIAILVPVFSVTEKCNSDGECQNGGKCIEDKVCVCEAGTSGEKCEIVDGCKEGFVRQCELGHGECKFDRNVLEKVSCVCTESDKVFNGTKCVEMCNSDDECENEGKCTGKNVCACKGGTSEDKCEVVNGCTADVIKRCESGNGKCKYNENVPTKASCFCSEQNKVFNGIKCVEICHNDADCEHDGMCTEGKFCKCESGISGDRCSLVDGCTEDFIQKCVSGNAKCKFSKTSPRRAACVCNEENKVFNGAKCVEMCYGDCDCEHEGTCTSGNFCKCPIGTSGDRCAIVDGCTPEFVMKCESGDGKCKFDKNLPEKFSCVCNAEKKVFNGEKCIEKCHDDYDCENGGMCNADNFCECEVGTSGDKCSIIDGCTDSFKQKCISSDATCIYEKTALTKASCFCNRASKIFNGENCVVPCHDNECKNGGTCTGERSLKFCTCLPGTTGDFCTEIIACNETNFCGAGNDVACGYDIKTATAVCICKEAGKLFDSNRKRCKECSCGPNGKCSFDNHGEKTCSCDKMYKDFEGECKGCYYGRNSDCRFNSYGDKVCYCPTGYAQYKGICKKCYCGLNSVCSFDAYGAKSCICEDNFIDFNGTCTDVCDTHPCVNGTCKIIPGRGFVCNCFKNYRGRFCDIKDEGSFEFLRERIAIAIVIEIILLIILISFLIFFRK